MILASLTGTPATLLTHLADAALRSLVLGCAAGVVLNVARVKSISVRLNVWRAVLCVALIMPFLGLLLPAVTFRLPAQIAQTIDEFHFASRAGTEVEPHAANESPRSVELAQNSRELHLSDSLANPVAGRARAIPTRICCVFDGIQIVILPPAQGGLFRKSRNRLYEIPVCSHALGCYCCSGFIFWSCWAFSIRFATGRF